MRIASCEQNTPASDAKNFAIPAINRAVQDIDGTTGIHLCFGYAAIVKKNRKQNK